MMLFPKKALSRLVLTGIHSGRVLCRRVLSTAGVRKGTGTSTDGTMDRFGRPGQVQLLHTYYTHNSVNLYFCV